MAGFRAGLLAAALATAASLPLAAVSARAEDQIAAQATPAAQPVEQAKSQGAAQVQNQLQNQVQNPAPDKSQACPGNPDALGTSRVLPIDFSQYQQLGRMQYPDSLPLNDKEVVITFDDGPLPPSTDKVLDALAAQCVKATFFMVGEMARTFPATVRRVYEEGHTIGTHSDHHPTGFGRLPLDRMREEIDGGIADVSAAFGGDSRYLAPFFRIPGFARSDLVESELARRGLIVFSADVVADDWHRGITPAKIISLAMSRLEARGKGILLLHDIHPKTAEALPGLLEQLKANGFHVVQVVPSAAYEMAMARRPAAAMLASAIPEELTIDDNAALPAWPQAVDRPTLDTAVLPAPNPAAFEPDTVSTDGSSEVHWPEVQASIGAVVSPKPAMRRDRHRMSAARVERRQRSKDARVHVAHAAEPERAERHRQSEHGRGHARGGAEGHRAEVTNRAVAALR
ncbi:MAG: polysaccharide deacetylase family protein [Xanthobacteraceae bacterium]